MTQKEVTSAANVVRSSIDRDKTLGVAVDCFGKGERFSFTMAAIFVVAGATVARDRWNPINGSRVTFYNDKLCRVFHGLKYLSPVVYSPTREDMMAKDWFVVSVPTEVTSNGD